MRRITITVFGVAALMTFLGACAQHSPVAQQSPRPTATPAARWTLLWTLEGTLNPDSHGWTRGRSPSARPTASSVSAFL